MHCAPFEVDIRHDDPNENRYRQREFRTGWSNAVANDCYSAETLLQLTWNNAGYRLGALFGPTSDDQIDDMYDWCVRQQRQHPRPLSPATPATVAGVSAEDAVRSVGIAPSPAAQRAPAGVGGTLRVVVQRNGLLQVQVGAALLELAPGDIVRQDVAAIVNAANESLANGGGVCGAIHRAAGVPQLEAACRALGTCPTGEARITSGFKLAAQHIIHAVGPRYRDHTPAHAAQLLENAYRASLELASIHRLPSIAFPSLSTGIFGFPIEQAAPVAVRTIVGYLAEHPEIALVRLVLRDDTRVAFETELLALVSA